MRSLTLKLTLAFLAVSLTGIALVVVLIGGITSLEFNRFLTDRGLNAYTTAVTTYYKAHGSWDGVGTELREKGLVITFSPGTPGQQAGNNPPPPPFVLTDPTGHVVVSAGPMHDGELLPLDRFHNKTAIKVNNQIVGYVLTTGQPRPDPLESTFMSRIFQALIAAAVGAAFIAILLGLLLARTITRPVLELTAATSALAEGHLSQQVPVRSKDELGVLAHTFNKMSADLEQANNLRRQMTADIAHDLRTPLAVITGYLEGLKDGIIKPTPQRFSAMYDESLFLQRLVEDLRTLSLADAGELSMNLQTVQPGEIIERLAATYQHSVEKHEIRLGVSVEPQLPTIQVDPDRIEQALSNLVSNALRYTGEGGEISLCARKENGNVSLEVKDTGSGISQDALPHIFERFYRGDDSRQEGGSGLGLAITKSIIELQGGTITAASDGPGTGSLFRITFPC